jgi:hypothetical protein
MSSLTRLEDQPPFASLKQVPPTWLVLISGGMCALITLAIAGLTGYPGGGAGSISLSTGQPVALSSRSTGAFLHVSLDDGLLKAGAKTAGDKVSHFYLVPVTEATVASLRVAAAATAKLASKWEDIKTVSRSGCNCTGFSNEHGFGRFCHSWELSYQEYAAQASKPRLAAGPTQSATHTCGPCLEQCLVLRRRVLPGREQRQLRPAARGLHSGAAAAAKGRIQLLRLPTEQQKRGVQGQVEGARRLPVLGLEEQAGLRRLLQGVGGEARAAPDALVLRGRQP